MEVPAGTKPGLADEIEELPNGPQRVVVPEVQDLHGWAFGEVDRSDQRDVATSQAPRLIDRLRDHRLSCCLRELDHLAPAWCRARQRFDDLVNRQAWLDWPGHLQQSSHGFASPNAQHLAVDDVGNGPKQARRQPEVRCAAWARTVDRQ